MTDYPARDLLGDPIPDNHGGRGRPAHIPTDRNRVKIRLLLAGGFRPPYIARALRITEPTLRRHYRADLRHADEARPALEAERRFLVYEAATKGNVGAMRELGRLIDRDGIEALSHAVQSRGDAVGQARGDAAGQARGSDAGETDDAQPDRKLGKKEQQAETAKAVRGLYEPPPPPSPRLMN